MINGYDDGSFVPDAKITEAEFLKMLISLYNGDLTNKSDLHWYDAYYKFAGEHKWDVSGLPSIDYRVKNNTVVSTPNKPLIRLEVAMILLNAIGKEADAPDELIWQMYNHHFSNGKTGKSVYGFQMNDLLTRAEAVTFIRNFKDNNTNKELLPVTQIVEANRVMSLSRISSTLQQLAAEKGYTVNQTVLNRMVREEGNIGRTFNVTSGNNPNFYISIWAAAEHSQKSYMNINTTQDAKVFMKEFLNRIFDNQTYKSSIMDAFEMMPKATPKSIYVDIPYNHSEIKIGDTSSFNIRLDESDKAPFGYDGSEN